MKKFIFLLLTAFVMTSCFEDRPNYSSEYVLAATFEYANFDMEALFGTDSLHFDEHYGLGLGWNDLAFYHKLNEPKTEFQGGFILSCLKGSVADAVTELKHNDLYRVNAPADSSRTYMVFHSTESMPAHDVEFTGYGYGSCKMVGCFVNVPKLVADAAWKNFKDGDSLVLKATGYVGENKTGEASINLITFTEAKDSVMANWTPFDMTKLGEVQYVEFELKSSSDLVPEAFCMDNMVANVKIEY